MNPLTEGYLCMVLILPLYNTQNRNQYLYPELFTYKKKNQPPQIQNLPICIQIPHFDITDHSLKGEKENGKWIMNSFIDQVHLFLYFFLHQRSNIVINYTLFKKFII